jgi:hypothetical protein
MTGASVALRHCKLCGAHFLLKPENVGAVCCSTRCVEFLASGVPSAADRERLDDPLRRLSLGQFGQFISCQGCGLTFESRGLRLCPDCCLVLGDPVERKVPSAAGRPVRKQTCLHCGGDLPAYLENGKQKRRSVVFCSSRCRLLHHRRQRDETLTRFSATTLRPSRVAVSYGHGDAVPAELAAQGVAGPNGSFDHV